MTLSMEVLRRNVALLLCDGNENNKRGYDALQKIDFAKKDVVEQVFNMEDELVRKYVLWRILLANDVQHIRFLERCLYKHSSMACYILWTLLHLGMKSDFLPKLYANKLFQEIILHVLVENLVENESLLRRVIASDLSDEKIRKYVLCIVKNHRFFYESALDHWNKIEDTSLKKAIVWLNMQHISLSKFVTNPWPLTIIDQEPDHEVKMYVVLGLYEHFYNKDILRAKYPADKRPLIVRLYRLLNLQCKNRTVLGKKTAMIRKLIIAAAQKRELSEENIKELIRQHIKDEVHNSILQFTKPQELDLCPPTSTTVREIESCFSQMSYAHHRAMNLEEVEVEETIYEAIEVEVEVEVPHTVGPYHILDLVGEGTCSVVYKAHSPDFPDIVALKVFKEIYDFEPVVKVLEKAKQAISLRHPNIIRVDDFTQTNDVLFITMEYFHSVTIDYLVKKHGPISPEVVMQLALQIVNALEYAHNKGIIHENIRPSNILVNRKGVVKILDVCLMELEYEVAKAMKSALGTIAFLSPEQLEDMRSVTSQTDIFSLGGVLYFALTGIYPFGEEPPGKVIEYILRNEPPPLSALVPDISSVLEETIMKCLAKKAAQRFSSIEELKQKLLSISQN